MRCAEQITLCRSGHFRSSAAYIDAIMHAIYQALLQLDVELAHQEELGARTHRLAGEADRRMMLCSATGKALVECCALA